MIVKLPPSSFLHSFWFRDGAGRWRGGFDHPENGWHFVSTLSAQMGRKSFKMELGAVALITYNSFFEKFQPIIDGRRLAGNFGFRYQKPDNKFPFRIGIGWPEYTYLSFGFYL